MAIRKQTILWGVAAVVAVLAVVVSSWRGFVPLFAAVWLFLWGLKTRDTTDMEQSISKELTSLEDWKYKPQEKVSYFQSHLDALDSKMWNSLLSSIGYLTIIMAMLAVLEIFDKPTHHIIYMVGYALVLLIFLLSVVSIIFILLNVGRPKWFEFSEPEGSAVNPAPPLRTVDDHCEAMLKIRNTRSSRLKIAFVLNVAALGLGVLFVIWWSLITLDRPQCPEWLYWSLATAS